ncbi:MAG: long-chain fatty acid--CoA ligase [Spirochaetes bacterium]|jgi:long-chain acyl-CoA synthetase|nr:long-chain fatty acid--CoA ligase [Spirochaetota bacterium]
MEIVNYTNIHEMIKTSIDRYAEQKAYRWLNERGDEESVTWREFYARSIEAAKGLLRLGIKKGDRIAILSATSYRWVLCDFASLSIGSCTVGIYPSSIPRECEYIIRHSGATVIFIENEEQLEKLRSIKKMIPKVKRVVLFNGIPSHADKWVMGFDAFLALGEKTPDAAVKKMGGRVKPSDLAFLVYTSGTTGVPKGVMITHDNLIFTAQNIAKCVPIAEGDETFLFLPLAHIFARVDIYATALFGITLSFARSIEHVIDDFQFARPHWFPCVPRVFEKVYFKVLGAVEAKGGIALLIFRWALGVGNRVSDLAIVKKPVPLFLGLQYSVARALVFKKLQAVLGGRIRFCVSGAAPLSPYVAKFFHAAGIIILEGYGMTENTSFTNITRMDAIKFGSVGFPAFALDQRIAKDGEIQYCGRNIMKGYYKMPRETSLAFTRDGWLKTGDIGQTDAEGFLFITDRKKDLIITSGGKNIAPALIEGMILESKYINQACLIGDRKKYLSVLLSLDMDNLKRYAERRNIRYGSIEELAAHRLTGELVDRIIAMVNKRLASFETVKRFTIVPDFTIEDGLLTPTMKIKRKAVAEKYRIHINAMYDEPTV